MAKSIHSDDDMKQFQVELASLLNRHSVDTLTDTPDFILARHLLEHLRSYGRAMQTTRKWHGWPTLSQRLGVEE